MSTLTETAYQARKVLLWGVIIIVAFFILRFLLGAAISWWEDRNPPPPPAPDVRFGKLPALKFPQNNLVPVGLTYRLGIIEGTLPEASSSARVYPIPRSSVGFLTLPRAKDFARQLGFDEEPELISQNQYLWTDTKYPRRTLKRDIITGNFLLSYDYLVDPSVLEEKNLPTPEAAIGEARGFLQGLGIYPPDLAAGTAKSSLWKFSRPNLTPAASFSEAEVVRVDFFREPQDDLPVLPPFYNQSTIFVLFSGSSIREKKVLTLNYNFWPLTKDLFATYPLKTTEQAWEELKNGGGFVASIGEISPEVVVRKVYLAYYDSAEYQSFLQPIFVFEGEKNFAAYIPAISFEWTE